MLSKGVVEEIRAAGKDKPNAPPRSHLKTSASSLNVLQCWDQTIGKTNWKWSGVTFNCTLDSGGKGGIRIWDPKSLILKCHDHWAKYFTMLVNKETKFWKNPLERERENGRGATASTEMSSAQLLLTNRRFSQGGGNGGDRQLLVSRSSPVSEPVVRFYQGHARRQRHTRHTQAVWCGTRDKRERAESGLSWDALYKDRITILIHRW